MEFDELSQFDLVFPGCWIEGIDRDIAWKIKNVFSTIETLYQEAVIAYALFQESNIEIYRQTLSGSISPYKSSLRSIYSKAFVFALNNINSMFHILDSNCLNPPEKVHEFCMEYHKRFGHLKHIRDSVSHIEDRGLGLDRKGKPINTPILLLGGFIENRFIYTGGDGIQYEIEISEKTLNKSKKIIQGIINCYEWSAIPDYPPYPDFLETQ